jgi:hypothetical protein
MSAHEIETYTEHNEFIEENERIGQCDSDFLDFDVENIWICELFKNKKSGQYSLLITRDSDETRIVFNIN